MSNSFESKNVRRFISTDSKHSDSGQLLYPPSLVCCQFSAGRGVSKICGIDAPARVVGWVLCSHVEFSLCVVITAFFVILARGDDEAAVDTIPPSRPRLASFSSFRRIRSRRWTSYSDMPPTSMPRSVEVMPTSPSHSSSSESVVVASSS